MRVVLVCSHSDAVALPPQADSFNIVLMDNSGAHTAKRLKLPDNVAFVFQPAASPELNPAERVWHDLKGKLAWQTFTTLEELQQELLEHLHHYQNDTLRSLTGFAFLLQAIHLVDLIHVVCS